MEDPVQLRAAKVVVSADALMISNLIETDVELVRYVGSATDPVDATRRCLRVGVRSVQAASAALDSETVRTQFDRLTSDFSSSVDGAIAHISDLTTGLLDDETGALAGALNGHRQQLHDLLDSQFDPDSKRSIIGKIDDLLCEALDRQSRSIRQAVSLDAADSPLRVMKSEIVNGFAAPLAEVSKQVHELSEKIAVNIAIAPVIEITTAKGFAFEEVVHERVCAIAAAHGDIAEMCGKDTGATATLKGDEVVSLNLEDTRGIERRFVLEAKTTKLTARATREELEAALANRAAGAAIAVFDSQAKAPTTTPFSYSGNRAVVVLDKDGDTAPLRLAYMWARWTVRREGSLLAAAGIDMDRVSLLIASAQQAIERHATIKRGHTQAKRCIDQAGSQVASLVTEIQSVLSDLEAELASDDERGE